MKEIKDIEIIFLIHIQENTKATLTLDSGQAYPTFKNMIFFENKGFQ
jgi:hypothetical protein